MERGALRNLSNNPLNSQKPGFCPRDLKPPFSRGRPLGFPKIMGIKNLPPKN